MTSNYPRASRGGEGLDVNDDGDESKSIDQRAREWEDDELDILGELMDDLKIAFIKRGRAFELDQRQISK